LRFANLNAFSPS